MVSQIANKHILLGLIRKLGEIYKEDSDFTRQYAIDVYNMNKESMDKAIECFRKLIQQAKELGICQGRGI